MAQMNLIPSNQTARIAVPDAQYKLAVVHASTGETLATTSAMSTSPQPAVDVAIVYRSQYTESSLVEEVRAVLDAAGMSYDLVDISRVSLVEVRALRGARPWTAPMPGRFGRDGSTLC